MVRGSVLFVLFLLWKQETVTSIKLKELRVPTNAVVGQDALLGCQFDLEDDILYSVKWYKDGREFYRYLPSNKRPALYFYTPGVTVDMSRSSSDVVTLTRLTRKSEGVYLCEVSGEAPSFSTVSDSRFINIHVLPKAGPLISGLKRQYDYGDRISVNCTSLGSRPEAQLRWLVNGKPVPKAHIRGQWFRVSSDPPDTTDVILQMSFVIAPLYFKNGVMEIKCQSTIAPLYHQEAVHVIPDPYAAATNGPDLPDDEDYGKPTTTEDSELSILDTTQIQVSREETHYKNQGFTSLQSLPAIVSSIFHHIIIGLTLVLMF